MIVLLKELFASSLQDLSEEYCRHLKTPGQKKSFEDFRNMRDSVAMDIAHVREYLKETTVSVKPEKTYQDIINIYI